MDRKRVDIVLPCFNPPPGWENVVIENVGRLRSAFPRWDIRCILVNDGSAINVTEGSRLNLEKALSNFSWISLDRNQGKGFALRTGVALAEADYIMYTDIDFPYTMESMTRCLDVVVSGGADLSLATRNKSYYDNLPRSRRWISRALKRLNRMIFRLETSDTQGGLKVFSQGARTHFLRTTIDRYLFDLEFVYLCSKDITIRVSPVECTLRQGIVITPVKTAVLRREGLNFLRLWLGGLG